MTSSPHGLYAQGCTRATMAWTEGSEPARGSQSQKARPSSDRRLQPAFVKLESLVIAGQQHRGECVPEPCTHRPSSHEREGRAKSPGLLLRPPLPRPLRAPGLPKPLAHAAGVQRCVPDEIQVLAPPPVVRLAPRHAQVAPDGSEVEVVQQRAVVEQVVALALLGV